MAAALCPISHRRSLDESPGSACVSPPRPEPDCSHSEQSPPVTLARSQSHGIRPPIAAALCPISHRRSLDESPGFACVSPPRPEPNCSHSAQSPPVTLTPRSQSHGIRPPIAAALCPISHRRSLDESPGFACVSPPRPEPNCSHSAQSPPVTLTPRSQSHGIRPPIAAALCPISHRRSLDESPGFACVSPPRPEPNCSHSAQSPPVTLTPRSQSHGIRPPIAAALCPISHRRSLDESPGFACVSPPRPEPNCSHSAQSPPVTLTPRDG